SSASPLRITLIYAGVGALWILLSDWFAGDLILDGAPLITTQTIKGLLYVTATAILVYALTRRAVTRIQSEHKKRHHDEKFRRAVADCLPLGVITLDPEGTVQSWNDSATRICGWTAQDT